MWKAVKQSLAVLSVGLNLFFAASWLGWDVGMGHQSRDVALAEIPSILCEEAFAGGAFIGVKDDDPVEESYTCTYSDGSYYRAFSTIVGGGPKQ